MVHEGLSDKSVYLVSKKCATTSDQFFLIFYSIALLLKRVAYFSHHFTCLYRVL